MRLRYHSLPSPQPPHLPPLSYPRELTQWIIALDVKTVHTLSVRCEGVVVGMEDEILQ